MSLHRSMFLIKIFAAMVMMIPAMFLIFIIGPALETKYFPVVDPIKILSVEAAPNESSYVTGLIVKHRDCSYLGVTWFHGKRHGTFIRVDWAAARTNEDQSLPNRPVGTQIGGPWIIGVRPEEVRDNSFADVYHYCYPFWTTRSRYYN